MQTDKNVKLKFYLRGVATGVAVSVGIMGILFHGTVEDRLKKEPDKQITSVGTPDPGSKEAADPSMESTEESVEASTQESTEESLEASTQESTEPSAEESTEESTEASTQESTEESTEASTQESSDPSTQESTEESIEPSTQESTEESIEPSTQESTGESTESSAPAEGEFVVINVYRGNSSYTVAKALADAGLVSDAKEYDAWLCRHGYDKRISVGSFQIPRGASEEEIAKIITSSN